MQDFIVYLLLFILLAVLMFIIFGVDVKKFFESKSLKKHELRKRKIEQITGKNPKGIRKILLSAEQMLIASGMDEKVNTYKVSAVLLALTGFFVGLLLDNLLLGIVLMPSLAAIPLAIIYFRTQEYTKIVNNSLENAITIITNSYIQTNDLRVSVENSLESLQAPLDGIFKQFLVEVTHINPNVSDAIRNMRNKNDNYFWHEWCDKLIHCQDDSILRYGLTGIVSSLSILRRTEMEHETESKNTVRNYLVSIGVVLFFVAIMMFTMPQIYEKLFFTTAGKVTLAIVAVINIIGVFMIVRTNRPYKVKEE